MKISPYLFLFSIFINNITVFIQALCLKTFNKNSWYANPAVWIISFVLFIFPAFILLAIFSVQMLCENANKLNVGLKELYYNPVFWIIGIIIPVIGWLALGVLSLYLNIAIIYKIYLGEAEQYI